MEPLVSVIVPVYNVAGYLEVSVNSILEQSYGNIEVFLIDDGSTDRCGEICDTFSRQDARVRVIHQKNAGISAARNRALKEAKGEYLAFVDGDDFLEPGYLEALVEAARKYDCGIAICNSMDKEGERLLKGPARFKRYAVYKGKNACLTRYMEVTSAGSRVYASVWAKIFRSSAVGKLRFDPKLRLGEDIAYMFQCLAKDISVVEVPADGYVYVRRPGSAMHGGVRHNILEAIPAWRIPLRVTKDCSPELRKRVARNYGFMLYAGLSQLIGTKDYVKYREQAAWLKSCCGKALRLGSLDRKHSFMLRLFCFSPGLYWRLVRFVLKAKGGSSSS